MNKQQKLAIVRSKLTELEAQLRHARSIGDWGQVKMLTPECERWSKKFAELASSR